MGKKPLTLLVPIYSTTVLYDDVHLVLSVILKGNELLTKVLMGIDA